MKIEELFPYKTPFGEGYIYIYTKSVVETSGSREEMKEDIPEERIPEVLRRKR